MNDFGLTALLENTSYGLARPVVQKITEFNEALAAKDYKRCHKLGNSCYFLSDNYPHGPYKSDVNCFMCLALHALGQYLKGDRDYQATYCHYLASVLVLRKTNNSIYELNFSFAVKQEAKRLERELFGKSKEVKYE